MKSISFNIIFLFLVFIPHHTKADVWDSPKVKEYYSKNKKYKFVVFPRIIPDKYYKWKYYKETKELRRSQQKKKIRFLNSTTESDTIVTPCHGQLFYISGNDTTLIWDRRLLNDVSPVYAIVSDDGSSVVTFDNWYSAGYGNNVMVVYNGKGDALRSYKLEEISPYPLNDYLISLSSIHWLSDTKFIDNVRLEITFKNTNGQTKNRIYNTKILDFET